MGAELGVTTSIFPSDAITRQFLAAQGREEVWRELKADDDAEYNGVIELDLSGVAPLVTQSPSPDNVKNFGEVGGTKVNQVIIGSCTNSSFRDLCVAAEILKGRRVHPDVSLLVAPGSRQVLQMITENGALSTFISAGARILESACGPCIGQAASPAEGTTSVRTFNRNFAGRTGTKNDDVFLASPEVAAIAALTGELTDPRTCGFVYPEIGEPESFLVDDSMIIPPPGKAPPIRRASTIGAPPKNDPLPERLDATVLIKVGDKITTDHIMPAGPFLKLRSNIPEYSKVVFNCFSEEGKPTFADRGEDVRDKGGHGAIVAGESYGQGSSREHAAICPMYLGIKAVIAKSFERIHHENLVNFGIMPLVFSKAEDYDEIEDGAGITIDNVRKQLQAGANVNATLASGKVIELSHRLTPGEIDIVLAGGKLNCLA